MPNLNRPTSSTILLLMLITLISCNKPPDERLVEVSERANARQQAQNETIAHQAEKAAELSQGFIDAEAKSRQELLALQQQVVNTEAKSREDLQRIHEHIVQRDADGRRELDELHRQAQTAFVKRTEAIDRERDLMEQERRQIAVERARAPVVAEAVKFVGGLIVCSLPLIVVIYLLRCLRRGNDGPDAAMVEVLVEELVAGQPRLLSRPRPPALPQASASDAASTS